MWDVGYAQRNFMTPLLEVGSYEELNAWLWKACQENQQRCSIGAQVAPQRCPILRRAPKFYHANPFLPLDGFSM